MHIKAPSRVPASADTMARLSPEPDKAAATRRILGEVLDRNLNDDAAHIAASEHRIAQGQRTITEIEQRIARSELALLRSRQRLAKTFRD